MPNKFEIDLDTFPATPARLRGHDNRKMPSVPIPGTNLTEHLSGMNRDLPEVPIYVKMHDGKIVLVCILPDNTEV